MTTRNNDDEGLAPPDKRLASLPPKIAAKIRRQKARQRLQEREAEPEAEAVGEEDFSHPVEAEVEKLAPVEEADVEKLAPLDEADVEKLAPIEEGAVVSAALPLVEKPSAPEAALPPEEPPSSTGPALKAPTAPAALDIRPRKPPTVLGVLRELGRGAWEGVSDFVSSSVRGLKRRRVLADSDFIFLTEDDLHERRKKIRGYVLLSSAIHVLLFLPIIHMAMIQEQEKKEPVYVRILDNPPPAKKVEKKATEAETTKTEKRVTKTVKAKGPEPEPKPVTRPTPTKSYAAPKQTLVAKATQTDLKAPKAPTVPKTTPTTFEARRPKSTPAPTPQEPVDNITEPTRPLALPEMMPKVASAAETLQERQTPLERRPTALEVGVVLVPDTEGRNQRLKDQVPENFEVTDRLSAPTEAPPLPPSQAPSPNVLGQAATVASQSAPGSPDVLAPEVATSSNRSVNERRTASTAVASLGAETGPVAPTQPVSITDSHELGPIGSAPTEFQEEITVPLNSDDPRFKEYLDAVKRRILEIWRYPDDAEPGLRGKVSLEFSIERDGSVSRVNIVTPSGHNTLDRGATEAMHLASPFPPFPPDFNTNRLNVVGGFRYN